VTVLWGALAGGAVGATIVASGVRLAQELGWTRMDIPFLLGTIATENRRSASVVGYFAHLASGLVFALLYAAVFAATGLTSWWFGLLLGFVQAAFVGGTLANLLLPAVHPPWARRGRTPRRRRSSSRPASCSSTTAARRWRSPSFCSSFSARS